MPHHHKEKGHRSLASDLRSPRKFWKKSIGECIGPSWASQGITSQ
ncbi:MAG: hypothetical protein OJF51_003502 [Nitrospira sp.]|nr:MAG: hypothetical protein OJF51_003502 [Nitrospira sp.]